MLPAPDAPKPLGEEGWRIPRSLPLVLVLLILGGTAATAYTLGANHRGAQEGQDHRQRNEELHFVLCEIVADLAQQAKLSPKPCPSSLT